MEIPIIPRKKLFSNPDKASVQLSPDGAQISYLAAENGVLMCGSRRARIWTQPGR